MRFLYSKKDKLKNPKDIEKLFREGKAFFSPPIRLIFLEHESEPRLELSAVVAPKKKLKKAHQRNRIKRLLRELIRHQLPYIREDQNHPLNKTDFIIVYTSSDPRVQLSTLQDSYDRIIGDIKK